MEKGNKAFTVVLEDLGKLLSTELSRKIKVKTEITTVGDVVQLKEDLPSGSWKFGKMIESIITNDGNVRAAKVLLPTRNVVNRPVNLLYPLECESEHKDQMEKPQRMNLIVQTTNVTKIRKSKVKDWRRKLTKRNATKKARDKILRQHLIDDETLVGMTRCAYHHKDNYRKLDCLKYNSRTSKNYDVCKYDI